MMTGEEFQALKSDISKNGQIEPVWLHPDGSIIDGRNRYKACIELDRDPIFRTWDGSGSLIAFVVSLNLHRRHLTAMQKAAVAVDMLPLLEAEAKERQREAGEQTHGHRWKNKDDIQLVEKLPQAVLDEKKKQGQENKSREQAAKLIGTSPRYVSDMKRYKNEAPEIYEAAKTGKINGSQAAEILKVDPEKRAAYINKADQLSANEIKKTARREQQKEHRRRIAESLEDDSQVCVESLESLTAKYRVIYADPPWKYGNDQTQALPGSTRPDDHYPPMSTPDICALPVSRIAIEGSVLFLWSTTAHLEEALQVLHAWGFRYKTHIVWDKDSHNYGPYTSVQHELLLIGTRGACTPEKSGSIPSVIRILKTDHSRKPDEFREIIKKMYPYGARIELFARDQHHGWDSWGNQA
jgi:N6-adenosine-specific RNA methylase IME4